MKKIVFLFLTLILISCQPSDQKNEKINGVMIDCSRLLEKQEYYYKLIDFMADWNMNTLLLHFSDDHGIAISLSGFEKLAMPHAFTPQDIKKLIAHGKKKGIEIIPELEVFGHTRYITDHPDYKHLYFGDKSNKISFNAIDPLNPETISLMTAMIKEVASLFPSEYLHLGCDEVNLQGLNERTGLDETAVWVDYVNKMIDIARNNGKTPMIWSDHIQKNEEIAKLLNKDIVLMEWNYDPDYMPTKLPTLMDMGYKNIIMCPSVSCWRSRIIPSKPQLKNVDGHAAAVRNGNADDLINTVWLPMRYLQQSMWYGMAYSAFLVNSNKPMNFTKFHKLFSLKTFGLPLSDEMNSFFNDWTELHLDRRIYSAIANNNYDILNDPERILELKKVKSLSANVINNRLDLVPKKNPDVLTSMYLSAEIMYVLSEGLLLIAEKDGSPIRADKWETTIQCVITRAETEWDQGRFPDDPAKYKAKFTNQENSHLLIVLRKLRDHDLVKN
ncbi:MAG: family 20 glycosylhydrolase [Candidatus Marinimicrobia bacterium]|nr:family 20 glycosylhydrolase [Candidatus Neomarinimicrobiota bacterium]